MRRIEAHGRDVAEGPGRAARRTGAEGVAVVLEQPEAVLLARTPDRAEVERVAERVSDEDGLGPRPDRLGELVELDVVRASSTSRNTGTSWFWRIALTVVGKPAATVITSSPGCSRRFPSRSLRQRADGEQVRRRAAVAEHRVPDAEQLREPLLEVSENRPAVSQKSSDASTRSRNSWSSKTLPGDGDRALAGDERRRSEGLRVICGDEFGNLTAYELACVHSITLDH